MKKMTQLVPDQVSRPTLVWVLVAQTVSIVPLLVKLPLWVAGVWLVALIWRVQIFRGRIGFPNAWLKLLLGGVCVVLIVASYAGVSGVEPMVGFLVCSFTLKLIEMRTRKDALIVLFIGFIAIAAQFLFAQGIASAVYGGFSFWILISAWRAVVGRRDKRWTHQLRHSFFSLAQSLPLLLIMFLIMPRIGPLWSVPMPKGQGQTGFSDRLKLGDISDLVKSQELAFRAEFEGVPPHPQSLYWRGLVLDQFDGREWFAGSYWLLSKLGAGNPPIAESLLTYTVILEPHQQQWLFSLGYPVDAASSQIDIRRLRTGLLFSTRPVAQRIQYQVASLPELTDDEATVSRDLHGLLDYPEGVNPRTRELARSWVAQGLTPPAIVERALELFRTRFYYTLKPERLGVHSVDEFLFETREGFCEHFAAAFVSLMRSAGIPSRIVVGYQGGGVKPNGVVTVRQADAHAWSEIWLGERGWVSVDPTAAVAPNRIELGVEQALDEADRQLLASSLWLSGLRDRWDTLSYSWQRWVLNYDNDKKDAFLSRWFGGSGPWRVALVFIGVCALCVTAIVVLYWLRQRPPPPTPEDRLIKTLIRRLGAMGYERAPEETLRDYLQRVGREQPALAEPLSRIADAYYSTKYRRPGQGSAPLREAIAALK